jgi:8-oxo-dGTP pyrophosphatase MutT (NUDIX family)
LTAAARDVELALRGATLPPEPWSSAVLCILAQSPAGLCVLLERRPPGPSFFGGHLSFPGGRREPGDADALATALRETGEEVGVAAADLDVLGPLAHVRDPLGRPVTCFVALLRPRARPRAASPGEVEEVLLVPVESLLQPGAGTGPWRALGYEARMLPGDERIVQYWPLDGTPPAVLWGFTAGLVAALLNRVWGWQPPSAPRVVASWDELRPK